MNRQLIEWDEATIAKLRSLWKSGDSAALIAEKLGCATGRLAVIGKAKRLNLGPHPFSKHKAKAGADRQRREVSKTVKRLERDGSLSRYKIDGPIRKRKPSKPAIVLEKVAERRPSIDGPPMKADLRFIDKKETWSPLPGSVPIPLVELTPHTCKWPVAEAPFLFCGLHTLDGKPWCETHNYHSHPRT